MRKGFLDLPFEVRLMIYEDLFHVEQLITLVPRSSSNPSTQGVDLGHDKLSLLAILQTCSTINREAAPLFYKHNRLMIAFDKPSLKTPYDKSGTYGITNLKRFLNSLSKPRLAAIRDLAAEIPVIYLGSHEPSETWLDVWTTWIKIYVVDVWPELKQECFNPMMILVDAFVYDPQSGLTREVHGRPHLQRFTQHPLAAILQRFEAHWVFDTYQTELKRRVSLF